MKLRWLVSVCVVMLAAIVWVRAEDKPAGDSDKPDKKSSGRLVQPWTKLSDLTDDQKAQIKDIHTKAMEQIKAIQEKELADITALLTDEQKVELKAIKEKMAADRKAKAGDASPPPDSAKKAD